MRKVDVISISDSVASMGALKICVLLNVLVMVSTKPIDVKTLTTPDNVLSVIVEEEAKADVVKNQTDISSRSLRNQIRPGIAIGSYSVELTPDLNDGTFFGRTIVEVSITDQDTREDPIILYARDLQISSVTFSILGGSVLYEADFDVDEDAGTLEIETGLTATLYNFHIEYTGPLTIVGKGFFTGEFGGK